jgi:hypothetical protein
VGLEITEYEFEIEHKPGKKHVNADSLSRYIASMKPEEAKLEEMSDLTEVGLTSEVVSEEQRKDAYYSGKTEDIQGAAREMICFDMDCTRPVGEIEG